MDFLCVQYSSEKAHGISIFIFRSSTASLYQTWDNSQNTSHHLMEFHLLGILQLLHNTLIKNVHPVFLGLFFFFWPEIIRSEDIFTKSGVCRIFWLEICFIPFLEPLTNMSWGSQCLVLSTMQIGCKGFFAYQLGQWGHEISIRNFIFRFIQVQPIKELQRKLRA